MKSIAHEEGLNKRARPPSIPPNSEQALSTLSTQSEHIQCFHNNQKRARVSTIGIRRKVVEKNNTTREE